MSGRRKMKRFEVAPEHPEKVDFPASSRVGKLFNIAPY